MIPSPYTPGEAPTVLAGRLEQIESAEADLALMATYGRFLGRIRVDLGARGVGKTSLLKAVRGRALEAGAVTAWATARGDESLVAALVSALTDALGAIGVDPARPRLRERVEAVSLQLGAGPAKAGVELGLGPAREVPAAAASSFAAFVGAAAGAAAERGSAGVCFLVDEVQAAPREDLRTLAYAWQELQQSQPEPPAVLFAAGLPNSPDVLTAAVTFSERFAFRTLHRLGSAEARQALVEPAARHEVSWAPELLELVLEEADGYPYFLQLYGDAVWRVARPGPGTTLEPALLAPARERVAVELDVMFRARWSKSTPAERRVLTAMATLTETARRGHGSEEPVRRGDIAAAAGIGTNDLSVVRRQLLDKGLVEVAARGELRFSIPGFAAFVVAEAGTGDGGPTEGER